MIQVFHETKLFSLHGKIGIQINTFYALKEKNNFLLKKKKKKTPPQNIIPH